MQKFLSSLLISTQLFALNNIQVNNLKLAYNIGKQIKSNDGISFENTLCAIMLTESSAGMEVIGDKYKDGKLKSLYDSSLGVFQIRLITAKEVIKKDKFMNKYFNHLLYNDKKLVNLLLLDTEFSAMIACTYLKMTYNYALKHKHKSSWRSAISRYNGGWNNTVYIERVMKRYENFKRYKLQYNIK